VNAEVIARGWADLANYSSLTTPSPLRAGTKYTMTFRLSTTDHIVPAGHRLGLVIGGTDSTMIGRPSSLPKVTVDLTGTSVRLPVAGAVPTTSEAPAFDSVQSLPDVTPGRLDG
jgi:X-Pro dipeptidyl-peptidase